MGHRDRRGELRKIHSQVIASMNVKESLIFFLVLGMGIASFSGTKDGQGNRTLTHEL